MKSDHLSKAQIKIADKVFPLNLSEAELERLPLIEKEINNKLIQYQSQYQTMGLKDAISLVLISYAFEKMEVEENKQTSLLDQTISQLESVLESTSNH